MSEIRDLDWRLHRLMTVDLPRHRDEQAAALAALLADILRHERVLSAVARDAEYERGSETRHDALTVFLELAHWHATCLEGGYQTFLRDDIKDAANRALRELQADEHGFREPVTATAHLQTEADLRRYIETL